MRASFVPRRRPALFLVVSLALAASAAAVRAWPDAAPPVVAWPTAPDAERIRYVMTIREPKDIGAGGSWLQRAASAVLGRARQPRVMRPRAMAVDRAGRLLIADPDQRMVHVMDIGNKKYSYLEPAPFASPVGLAVGSDNSIYVADSARRRVFVYGPDLRRRTTLGVVDGKQVFGRPTGIAVGPGGHLYVVDTTTCTVTEMTREGSVVHVIGGRGTGDGQFNYPTDITVARDGRLWVLDSMNARLQVLEADGRFVRQFGRRGNGTGDFDKPKGVALDSDGHVYVADAMHDVVQIFDAEGQLLLVFGGSGGKPGQFNLPSGVHIDSGNWVYVADGLNNRVEVFRYVGQSNAH